MTRGHSEARTVFLVLAAIVGLAVMAVILAGWTGRMSWAWGGMMGVMWIWMLLPIILVALLVVLLANQRRTPPKESDPLAVAERRYAAGQITRDEFTRIRDDIRGRHP